MTLAALRLRKGEDRRLRAGHLWVFSNEVDTATTPLSELAPGQPVVVQDSRGASLGSGYVNPHSLICARLIARQPGKVLDGEMLRQRFSRALALRQRLYREEPYYRLIYGEADGVPGLVVDRFGDVLVAQITTAGVERVREDVVQSLSAVVPDAAILLRNDTASRALEGLASYVEAALGPIPERVQIRENGVAFDVALGGGQKTGWFYDHRENRARLARYVNGARVLDVFSYVGGWGIQAAVAGAARVVCVDSSAPALESLRSSAVLNGVEARVEDRRGDAFELLRDLKSEGEQFDVVVLDPPAFIKRRKDARRGLEAYQRLNRLAMDLLGEGGIIVSASCSHHLSRDDLRGVMLRASRELRRDLQLLEEGGQGPDHPVHPAIPETSYLKAFFGRLLA
jgi:23S rRNA (cytosine1962-C5)-methyltransferase